MYRKNTIFAAEQTNDKECVTLQQNEEGVAPHLLIVGS